TSIGDDVDSSLSEHVVDARTLRPEKPRLARVVEQEVDRLGGVLLVRPDDSGGAALDPARAVDPGNHLSRLFENAATLVRHRAGAFVERGACEPDSVVADAPKDDPGRDDLPFVGRDRANTP